MKELLEAGKKPLDIKWNKTNNEWYGKFIAKEQPFEIEITLLSECNKYKAYQFKFYRDKSTKLTNDMKYPFQVVPTIKKAIDDYVKTSKPDMLLFSAEDNSNTRKSMYKKQGGVLASKYDYNDISNIKGSEGWLFGIYKDEDMIDCFNELLNESNNYIPSWKREVMNNTEEFIPSWRR